MTNDDRTNRTPHHRYADYFVGTVAEVVEHDGVRLVPNGCGIPVDLVCPLVVTDVSAIGGLVSLSVIDRASMVDEALGNLPEGVAMAVATLVYNEDEPILIRL